MSAKELIRDFFIKNYAVFTHTPDVLEAEAASTRYEEMLRHYFEVVEKNGCRCIKGKQEIMAALENNRTKDEEYIRYGQVKS